MPLSLQAIPIIPLRLSIKIEYNLSVKLLKILLFFLPIFLCGEKPSVMVTIPPYAQLARELVGDQVEVVSVVPAGADMHTFEPTPRQVDATLGAQIWFQVGEHFEKKLEKTLKNHNPKLQTVDLKQGVELMGGTCSHGHCTSDLHFWLDPIILKTQVKTMGAALCQLFPESCPEIRQREASLLAQLTLLDQQIRRNLSSSSKKTFLVSHPSFSYFAKRYGLTQLSVEHEGREPSPREITRLLRRVKEHQVAVVFTQPQFNNKGAEILAKQLNLKVVEVDPYSASFLDSIETVSKELGKE